MHREIHAVRQEMNRRTNRFTTISYTAELHEEDGPELLGTYALATEGTFLLVGQHAVPTGPAADVSARRHLEVARCGVLADLADHRRPRGGLTTNRRQLRGAWNCRGGQRGRRCLGREGRQPRWSRGKGWHGGLRRGNRSLGGRLESSRGGLRGRRGRRRL
jgi:hypothetical protein